MSVVIVVVIEKMDSRYFDHDHDHDHEHAYYLAFRPPTKKQRYFSSTPVNWQFLRGDLPDRMLSYLSPKSPDKNNENRGSLFSLLSYHAQAST